MSNGIFNWETRTVTWGEEVIDVSTQAAGKQPVLVAFRMMAQRFDSAAEDIVRHARRVEQDALTIALTVEARAMPNPLHHQSPSDLNAAIATHKSLAESLRVLHATLVASRVEA
jgi:hypothetical protein